MRWKQVQILKTLVVTSFLFATISLWHIHSSRYGAKHEMVDRYQDRPTNAVNKVSRDNRATTNVLRRETVIHIDEWKPDDFCLSTLSDVYWHPLFPNYPSRHRQELSLDQISIKSDRAAIRKVMFLICPPSNGRYQFSISVEGGFDLILTEWTDEVDVEGKNTIYHFHSDNGFFGQREDVASEWIDLTLNKVYKVDLVHWTKSNGSLEISWRSQLLNLTKKSLDVVCAHPGTNIASDEKHVLPNPPITLERQKSLNNPLLWFYTREQRTLRDFNISLKSCNYYPSYLSKEKVEESTGWTTAVEGKFFPYYPLLHTSKDPVQLPKSTASQVASEVFEVVQKEDCRDCRMDRIIFVQENRESKGGKRYFVEIDVTDITNNRTIRVSDHVFKNGTNSSICLPSGHLWSLDVDVNVVFTTSSINEKWNLFMLDSISRIVYATGDRNVRVWIAAYGFENIDLEYELTKRNLQGTVLRLPGKFNKVRGLNAIVNAVHDPESIIFTLDLHLELPFHLFDQARKNTIPGRTIFAPVLVRLPCGKHVEYTDPGGSFWVFNGFGVLGMYKKDWDIIGGMNEKLFGTKWGGEDWEIMDRVVSKGYEVIRRRLSGFYHIYHSRKGAEWYQ